MQARIWSIMFVCATERQSSNIKLHVFVCCLSTNSGSGAEHLGGTLIPQNCVFSFEQTRQVEKNLVSIVSNRPPKNNGQFVLCT